MYFNTESMKYSNPDLILRLWRKKMSALPLLLRNEYGADYVVFRCFDSELWMIKHIDF